MSGDGRGENKEAYDTGYSQAVTHPSTNPARQSLTSVIGREPVFSLWYGRRQGNQGENLLSYKGIEREGYLSGWLVAVEQHRQQSPLSSERKACCCVVALAGWHSGQGSRVCNSTTISSVQEPCSTLAGVGHFGHRFSAFWLRSSVVSVLISLISDTLLIEQLIY